MKITNRLNPVVTPGSMRSMMLNDPCPFVDRRTTRLSREEISDLLRFRHWIPGTRGIGGNQRDLILVLIRVGVFKKSRTHFSKLEPKMHLQRADQQLDGTWILSFDNGKKKWTHTWHPPERA
jgi:hypothetical protein